MAAFIDSLNKTTHSELWDGNVGSMLSSMMQLAGYSCQSISIHRTFFSERVARSLGRFPTKDHEKHSWKSFMTDDHTPVELSWSWSEKKTTPVVRYAVEPIGWLAGTDADSLNTKASVVCLGDALAWAPTLDLHWYRHFLKKLTLNSWDDSHDQGKAEIAMANNPPSQTFIGFDLEKDSIVVKYYFIPSLKAAFTNQSNLDLVTQTILSMPEAKADASLRQSVDIVLDFIRSYPAAEQPQVEIFAIDCISPADSRLKIYIRTGNTTFNNMIDVMTLGGRIPTFSEPTVACLRGLWCSCFGVDDLPEVLSQSLRGKSHRTGGLLYYLELKMGSAHPSSKVYLPVRHYAKSDDQVARGLSKFLEKKGKCLEGGLSYYDGVTKLCRRDSENTAACYCSMILSFNFALLESGQTQRITRQHLKKTTVHCGNLDNGHSSHFIPCYGSGSRIYTSGAFCITMGRPGGSKYAHGKQIRGPYWARLNGQTLEKFLNGRSKSQEWQQYGHVYRVWAATTPEIVITKPEDVRAFHTDSNLHQKARSSNAGWMFHQLLGECMGLVNGQRWNKLREEFSSSFTHPAIVQNTKHVSQEAEAYVRAWETQQEQEHQHQPSGFTTRASTAVSKFPFFCTATHLYGHLAPDEKDTLWELGQRSIGMMGYVLSGDFFRFPFARFLYRQAMRDLDSFMHDCAEFNARMYQSRSGVVPRPPIVSVWQQVLDDEITEKEALHTLSEILFANLDVSTGNLSWLVIYLATEESIQEELVGELKGNGHDIEQYCSRKDTLLAHCLLETFRLRPFTVFSIPESSPNEKVLGGYRIPPNTSVVVDTLAVNYNRSFWGDKAEIFYPKRFRSIRQTDLRYNLFTFGFGTRKCLGSHLAELMMKLFIVHLLNRYSLRMPPGAQSGGKDTLQETWVPIPDKEVVFERREKSVF
ncbi:hypothetical protein ARSEF1564_007754 [Beauveria bassiana]